VARYAGIALDGWWIARYAGIALDGWWIARDAGVGAYLIGKHEQRQPGYWEVLDSGSHGVRLSDGS
jgi:hypothetical protein